MPRQKKEKLKKRKDGRYRTMYKNLPFYGKTAEEAIEAREAYKKLEKEGFFDKPITPPMEDFVNKWYKNHTANNARQTKVEIKTILDKLTDRFGYSQINQIKPSDIKELYTDEFTGYSDSYVKRASQIYKRLFDAAVEDGLCKFNPARMTSAQPHKGYEGSHRAITEIERKWILENCREHRLYPAVMAMLYAGIRPPEAKALNLDKAFDKDNMTLSITEFVHVKDNNHYEVTEKGKTKKSTRKIPVFPPLYQAIKDKTGQLVPTKDGNTITIQGWKSAWDSYVNQMETAINGCQKRWYGRTREHKAVLEAGGVLPPWRSFTVVPYDLRHSFCTMCRDNGVELNTCIHWMGHTDAKMILKIYDEFSETRSYSEAKKLNQIYFQVQTGGSDKNEKDKNA